MLKIVMKSRFILFSGMMVSTALFLTFCSSKKSEWKHYSELIKHVMLKDQTYLSEFKKSTDENWSDKWKLVDARIDDARINALARFAGEEKPIVDTSCVLDWNQSAGTHGVIREETYNNLGLMEIKLESTQLLMYENDSVYATGYLRSIMGSNLQLQYLLYLKKKRACKPCGDFTSANFGSMGSLVEMQHEEIQIIDSLGNTQCTYSSPRFTKLEVPDYYKELKISISSDTIITSNGSCKFIELKANE